MLRQLARLTRAVPAAGPAAVALAVYADADDALVPARESGVEGVACVDDAARAILLLCAVWEDTRLPWVRTWCEGLLDFLAWMQNPDGQWVNFVSDWDGTRNRGGSSSVAGGAFWQARALQAAARAAIVLDDARADAMLDRGIVWMRAPATPDVRALHVMTAVDLLRAGRFPRLRDHLTGWIDQMLTCTRDGMLMNAPNETGSPHLWGHVEEAALADGGALLGRDGVVDVARRSGELLFRDVIGAGFDLPHVQPYDVASAILVMDRLHAVTGAAEYAALAQTARRWFDGRNPARRPVYDTSRGRVADGIDQGRLSRNSGAESNIVGAHALLDRTVEQARRLGANAALPWRDAAMPRRAVDAARPEA
ncbi:MAG TPA: hypothetical protein VFC09_02145 [Candidatus Dormibacteraeota bacterium]|nr:hypothetical protein [Candidatus Dormibacteraeota bacterium]